MLDGAYIARRLRDIENILNTEILDELRLGLPYPLPAGAALDVAAPTLKTHGPHLAGPHGNDEGVIFPMQAAAAFLSERPALSLAIR